MAMAESTLTPSPSLRVWSIPHLRSEIVSHLSLDDKASLLTVNGYFFQTSVEYVYEVTEALDAENIKRCRHTTRKTMYESAVRHIEIVRTNPRLRQPAKWPTLLEKFPNARNMSKGEKILHREYQEGNPQYRFPRIFRGDLHQLQKGKAPRVGIPQTWLRDDHLHLRISLADFTNLPEPARDGGIPQALASAIETYGTSTDELLIGLTASENIVRILRDAYDLHNANFPLLSVSLQHFAVLSTIHGLAKRLSSRRLVSPFLATGLPNTTGWNLIKWVKLTQLTRIAVFISFADTLVLQVGPQAPVSTSYGSISRSGSLRSMHINLRHVSTELLNTAQKSFFHLIDKHAMDILPIIPPGVQLRGFSVYVKQTKESRAERHDRFTARLRRCIARAQAGEDANQNGQQA